MYNGQQATKTESWPKDPASPPEHPNYWSSLYCPKKKKKEEAHPKNPTQSQTTSNELSNRKSSYVQQHFNDNLLY